MMLSANRKPSFITWDDSRTGNCCVFFCCFFFVLLDWMDLGFKEKKGCMTLQIFFLYHIIAFAFFKKKKQRVLRLLFECCFINSYIYFFYFFKKSHCQFSNHYCLVSTSSSGGNPDTSHWFLCRNSAILWPQEGLLTCQCEVKLSNKETLK